MRSWKVIAIKKLDVLLSWMFWYLIFVLWEGWNSNEEVKQSFEPTTQIERILILTINEQGVVKRQVITLMFGYETISLPAKMLICPRSIWSVL